MKKATLLTAIAFLFFSCEKRQLDDCFSSTGSITEEIRSLAPFSKLKIGDRFEVLLIQDSSKEEHALVRCGKNIQEGISFKVNEGGWLEISNDNTCNFVRSFKTPIEIEIHLRELNEIMLTGATNIRTKDSLTLQSLVINHWALSDIDFHLNVTGEVFVNSINSAATILRGNAFKLSGSIEEVSDLDAQNLICQEVLLDTHTPRDCFVNGEELIFVKIYNSGNIFYVVEPHGRKEINVQKGSGDLIKIKD
jgi:hypothetical protein